MPQIGQEAPDFCLLDQDGRDVRLSDFRGARNVVLFFYPKDETPVCTAECRRFASDFGAFEKDAAVLGVSADDRESHQKFRARLELPFPLLSDPGRKVAKQYGATLGFGLLPGRATFVIDRSGVVRHVTSALFQARVHVEEALAALASLK
jgi:peroxiredoxin Q/BCP